MQAMLKVDAPTREGVEVSLRTEVYDALAAAKGVTTRIGQARMHGINKTTLVRIRNEERVPNLRLAMRMAADLGTTVEALFVRKDAA